MTKRDGYEDGTFIWVDLATNDTAGAKAFYTGLLGWTTSQIPMGWINRPGWLWKKRLFASSPPSSRHSNVPPHTIQATTCSKKTTTTNRHVG